MFDMKLHEPCDVFNCIAGLGLALPDSPDRLFRLLSGECISGKFYANILLHVESRITELNWGCVYALEDICGSGFCEQLSIGEREIADLCVADMVSMHLLPISVSEATFTDEKFYRLQ